MKNDRTCVLHYPFVHNARFETHIIVRVHCTYVLLQSRYSYIRILEKRKKADFLPVTPMYKHLQHAMYILAKQQQALVLPWPDRDTGMHLLFGVLHDESPVLCMNLLKLVKNIISMSTAAHAMPALEGILSPAA